MDAVEPPAPQVTVTNSGRRAWDMRSRRVCRLAKPYSKINDLFSVRIERACGGATNHGRLGREELE